MQNILFFVHTEYHLLLSVNQILGLYNDPEKYQVELFIRAGGKRLAQELNFSGLPISVYYFKEEISITTPLNPKAKNAIDSLIEKRPDIFIFFQEMDPLMVILAGQYAKTGSEVHLYQDGLKPYVHIKFHSLGLLKHFHRQNLWMKKNGFPVESWLSPIWAKKYAHLKSIQKVFLTFPEAYVNWSNKALEKIEMVPIPELNQALKKVFCWDDALLPDKEKIVFYLNQPMRDDGIAETSLLKSILEKFPETKIYTKNHPHTPKEKIEQYKKIKNMQVIDSLIPAELFIMNLSKSIIISQGSTSMFLDNPENKFYYIYELLVNDIKRLRRYKMCNPAPHIKSVKSIDEITF